MDIDTLLKDVNAAAEAYKKQNDPEHRIALREKVRQLHNATTSPPEKFDHVRFAPMLCTCVRIAHETGVLQALVDAGGKVSAADLAKKTGTDELLIARTMRVMAYGTVVDETGPREYAANDTTKYSVGKGVVGSVKFYSDIAFRVFSHAGPMIQNKQFEQFPGEGQEDAFEKATGKDMFGFLRSQQEYNQAFADFMSAGRSSTKKFWHTIYPAEQKLKERPVKDRVDEAVIVDVAGGQGMWTRSWKDTLPQPTKGRFVVEDQPSVVKDAPPAEGVEYIGINFVEKQPVVGSRFYMLKHILHDWPDWKCKDILKPIKEAMEKGYSTLLINDLVLPEKEVGFRDASLDVALMIMSSGIERDEKQWRTLLEQAGLKVVKIWRKEDIWEGNEAVIECELP